MDIKFAGNSADIYRKCTDKTAILCETASWHHYFRDNFTLPAAFPLTVTVATQVPRGKKPR
jgi:hypothetical protein